MDGARSGAGDDRSALPPDLPDDHEADAEGSPRGGSSLMADIDALIADGKTYLEAEVAYQKSRAGFTANRVKWGVIYAAAAFGLLHLALIALTVGAVIALAPLIGPWLATGAVVVLLLAGAAVLLFKLRSKVDDVRAVFDEGEP